MEGSWSWSWQGSNNQEGHGEIFGRYHKDNGKPMEDVKLDGDMIRCAGCASREQEWCERGWSYFSHPRRELPDKGRQQRQKQSGLRAIFEVECTGLDRMDEDQRKMECVGSMSNCVGVAPYTGGKQIRG